MSFAAAPPGWQITFTADNESWTEPVIGWAVVAINTRSEGTETTIETILIDSSEGFPCSLREYMEYRGDYPAVLDQIKYSIEYHHPSA
jgi:hypothetical protein